jgi:hypothetical protein
LNLRENQLSWLPESIGLLFSLAKLDIEQNKPSPHMTTYLQILSAAAPRAAPADPAFVSTAPPAPQALVKHFWEMLASHWSPSRSKVYVLGDGAISLNYVCGGVCGGVCAAVRVRWCVCGGTCACIVHF